MMPSQALLKFIHTMNYPLNFLASVYGEIFFAAECFPLLLFILVIILKMDESILFLKILVNIFFMVFKKINERKVFGPSELLCLC